MFQFVLFLALSLLALSILFSLFRVIKGPSMPDRVVALDAIGINLVAAVAILSIVFDTYAFLEIMLLLGILAFVSTIALSKFIERGVVIERKRDQ